MRYPTLPLLGLLVAMTSAAPAAPSPNQPASSLSSIPEECTRTIDGMLIWGKPIGDTCRYTVRYAQAQRWAHSIPYMGRSRDDPSELPKACPQEAGSPVLSDTRQREDCLFNVIYEPKRGPHSIVPLPVFVWIHGGSYLAGTAAAPGLDGSQLASLGKMVVIVPQYRLGVLGQLPPALGDAAGDPNLALNDVINALTRIGQFVTIFGGDPRKVTIAGQSSGASMVRALLAAPKAKGLFRAAILQSDPMTYGTASLFTTNQLRSLFYSMPQVNGCVDLQCLQRKPLADILAAQRDFLQGAPAAVQGVPFVTPVRPTHGTPSLPLDTPTRVASYPSPPSSVPILITTTTHEAGSVTQSIFPFAVPADNNTYFGLLAKLVGPERAAQIVQSREYALPPSGAGDDDILRQSFERLVSNGVWHCPNLEFARRWARPGGKVWVGQFTKGVSYVSNQGGSYCTGGRVCHEDDIFPTFHSVPNPTNDQLVLVGPSTPVHIAQQLLTLQEDDVVRRWSTFVHTLDPNPRSIGTSNIALPPGLSAGDVEVSVSGPLRPGWREPGKAAVDSPRGPLLPELGGRASRKRAHVKDNMERGGLEKRPAEKRQASPEDWVRYTGNDWQILPLCNGQRVDCPPGFWGEKVRYDWQIYG